MDIYNKILENPIEFDWDYGNVTKNKAKHKVDIDECEEIFTNKPIIFFGDEKHSIKEKRYGCLGVTNQGRQLSIVFTIRKNKIRVITARDQSRQDRKIYLEELSKHKERKK